MRWPFLWNALGTVAVLALACAGDGGARDGLAGLLPDLVPQVGDMVEEFSAAPDEVRVLVADFRSNEDMASELPGDLLQFSDDLEEIRVAGRVDGYLIHYQVGPPGRLAALANTNVRIALDLYTDEAAAQRALEREPPSISGDAIAAPRVGDASVAWPQALVGTSPDCPCHFRFRVGRVVAAVATSYGGPARHYNGQPDPAQVRLAEVMAERMRQNAD